MVNGILLVQIRPAQMRLKIDLLILFGGGNFMDWAHILAYINSCSLDKGVSDIFPTTVLHSYALSDILSNERRL